MRAGTAGATTSAPHRVQNFTPSRSGAEQAAQVGIVASPFAVRVTPRRSVVCDPSDRGSVVGQGSKDRRGATAPQQGTDASDVSRGGIAKPKRGSAHWSQINSPPRSAGGIAPPLGGESNDRPSPFSCDAVGVDRTIDYSPLFAPVTPDEVRTYRVAELATPEGTAQQTVRVISWVVGGVVIAALAVTVLVPLVAITVGVLSGSRTLLDALTGLPAIVIVVVVGFMGLSALKRNRAAWEQRVRMSRFAAANGLLYARTSAAPEYPGAIFGIGSSRHVTDHFRTVDGRFLDFGNYAYTTGSGRSRRTHHWGFLAMQLERSLPHMLLDSTANNGMFGSNLPTAFRREQVLSLEGDFDRYFTLYCPTQYERDALYVFTPDLMALLIDEAAPFDVEIVDRWLFVYAAQPFPLADPATYQRLLRIVSTVGAKALSQTDRYVDERIGVFEANLVAPSGQRLRRGVNWGTVVIMAIFMIIWSTAILSSYGS